jgi:hypothetical protein
MMEKGPGARPSTVTTASHSKGTDLLEINNWLLLYCKQAGSTAFSLSGQALGVSFLLDKHGKMSSSSSSVAATWYSLNCDQKFPHSQYLGDMAAQGDMVA